MSSLITEETKLKKKIEQYTIGEDALELLKNTVRSCPSNFTVPLENFFCQGAIDTNYNLIKLAEFFPSAAATIKKYFFIIGYKNDLPEKKVIERTDVLKAFAGDAHQSVVSSIVGKLKSKGKPLLFTNSQISDIEYLFSHLVKAMQIRKENDLLVGYHESGAKVIGLYFPGSKSSLKRLLMGKLWGAVHFATIVDIINKNLKNEISDLQKNSPMMESFLFADIKNKTIDYTTQLKDQNIDSTLEWTIKRFEYKKHKKK